MAYQPIPPPQMAAAPARRRGAALIWVGVLFIVVGIATALVLWFAAQQRFDSRVKSLAEDSGALSGCVTDLTFTKTGTFVFYYISSGDVHVNGSNEGCADDDVVTIDADKDVPDIEVTLRNSSEDHVRLGSTSLDENSALEAGGVTAWPYRAANITEKGDYSIEITGPADAPRFAIGVGPAIEEPTLVLPLAIALAGLILGIVLIIVGITRRNRMEPIPVTYGYQVPTFQPPAQYPTQPPVVYNPPAAEGFDHPTQAMPPIVTSPEPVGPFEPTGWKVPGQPLPPPGSPPVAPAGSPPPRPPTAPAAPDPSTSEWAAVHDDDQAEEP